MIIKILGQFYDFPIYVEGGIIRPKYYKIGDKIPKKYLNTNYYNFIEDKLCDLRHNTPVIQNEGTANKPRMISLTGNKLHSLTSVASKTIANQINLIKNTLKQYFLDRLNKDPVSITSWPIKLELIIRCEFDMSADLDNFKIFYEKVLFDCIQSMIYEKEEKGKRAIRKFNPKGVIVNDNMAFVTCIEISMYFISEEFESRSMTLVSTEYSSDEKNKLNERANKFSKTKVGTILSGSIPSLELYKD